MQHRPPAWMGDRVIIWPAPRGKMRACAITSSTLVFPALCQAEPMQRSRHGHLVADNDDAGQVVMRGEGLVDLGLQRQNVREQVHGALRPRAVLLLLRLDCAS